MTGRFHHFWYQNIPEIIALGAEVVMYGIFAHVPRHCKIFASGGVVLWPYYTIGLFSDRLVRITERNKNVNHTIVERNIFCF